MTRRATMHAGFSSVDITPDPGCQLEGFVAKLAPASGVDAPLAARALWLETSDAASLIVALDLLGLDPWTAQAWCKRLGEALGLHESNVHLTCTHTHAGPMTMLERGLGGADPAVLARVEAAIGTAAARAKAGRSEATLRAGRAGASVGVNRRKLDAQGRAVMEPNAMGPCDRLVRVLQVRTAETSIVLFMHAAHPYCVGAGASLISADFCGHATAALEEAGHQAMFVNGCAGNIMPAASGPGGEAAREEGRRLATAALAALPGRAIERLRLWSGATDVMLPHDAIEDLAAAERTGAEAVAASEAAGCDPRLLERVRRANQDWTADLRGALARGGGKLAPLQARVSLLRVGEVAIVMLPGEVFFEIGQGMTQAIIHSGLAPEAWAVGYAHGYIGYVPTPEAYPQGGYEVDDAHRYLGLWRIAPHAGRLLHDAGVMLAQASNWP